jgi:hypothetical protein
VPVHVHAAVGKQHSKPLDIITICLFTVLRPAQEFFTYMETSSLLVKGCKIWTFEQGGIFIVPHLF